MRGKAPLCIRAVQSGIISQLTLYGLCETRLHSQQTEIHYWSPMYVANCSLFRFVPFHVLFLQVKKTRDTCIQFSIATKIETYRLTSKFNATMQSMFVQIESKMECSFHAVT